jgi:diguanylate cyclase (GGDEF)-like protein
MPVIWWDKKMVKALLLPGGICVSVTVLVLNFGLITLAPSAIHFYYYAVFVSGVLLAWRFHSSKVLFALLTLFLAHRALQFFFSGRAASPTGHAALEVVSVLLPLNFVLFSASRERGINLPASLSRICLLFLEATFVAIVCRPGESASQSFFHAAMLGKQWQHWTRIPSLGGLVCVAVAVVLLAQFLLHRRPVDSGLLWAVIAVLFAFDSGSFTLRATVYVATAALVLTTSVIENSYVLAYQDELTSLAARRAFNDALLDLQEPYALATVDIDHFKSFNDTYGHETGDQVLRMVATCLAHVEGGGRAFRVGGEEFSILFPRKSLQEVLPHLETLRWNVENTAFRLRGAERRSVPHGTDRRKPSPRKKGGAKQPSLVDFNRELSVTVSIGVAEPSAKLHGVENVIRAADKALYNAKAAGRNRVISAHTPRTRTTRASNRSA